MNDNMCNAISSIIDVYLDEFKATHYYQNVIYHYNLIILTGNLSSGVLTHIYDHVILNIILATLIYITKTMINIALIICNWLYNKHRFDAIDKKFDAIDEKVDAIDEKFEAVDKRFDTMDTKFDELKTILISIQMNTQPSNTQLIR